jgi:hypothetical protein
MRLALAVAMLLCGDDQCWSRAVAKDPMPTGQPQLRIDDDPVTDGMAARAIGSDTGGSIPIPAARPPWNISLAT